MTDSPLLYRGLKAMHILQANALLKLQEELLFLWKTANVEPAACQENFDQSDRTGLGKLLPAMRGPYN